MTIHSDDQDRICRLLGMENIPGDVEEAYEVVRCFFHADGGTGALPAGTLTIMLWMLGHKPRSLREPPAIAPDFRRLPADGSVRVEVYDRSEWKPGVFLGPMDTGIVVRLDGEVNVREFAPVQTRLEQVVKKDSKRGRAATQSVASA